MHLDRSYTQTRLKKLSSKQPTSYTRVSVYIGVFRQTNPNVLSESEQQQSKLSSQILIAAKWQLSMDLEAMNDRVIIGNLLDIISIKSAAKETFGCHAE